MAADGKGEAEIDVRQTPLLWTETPGVIEKNTCSICSLVFQSPTFCNNGEGGTEACGHIFCQECIRKALSVNPTCPLCRRATTDAQLVLLTSTSREIADFELQCNLQSPDHVGCCTWIGTFGVNGANYLKHASVIRCKTCPAVFTRALLQTHTCLEEMVKCDKCKAPMQRKLLGSHACPLEQVPCPFSTLGCKAVLLRAHVDRHSVMETKAHLDLVLLQLAAQAKELAVLRSKETPSYTWRISNWREGTVAKKPFMCHSTFVYGGLTWQIQGTFPAHAPYGMVYLFCHGPFPTPSFVYTITCESDTITQSVTMDGIFEDRKATGLALAAETVTSETMTIRVVIQNSDGGAIDRLDRLLRHRGGTAKASLSWPEQVGSRSAKRQRKALPS